MALLLENFKKLLFKYFIIDTHDIYLFCCKWKYCFRGEIGFNVIMQLTLSGKYRAQSIMVYSEIIP